MAFKMLFTLVIFIKITSIWSKPKPLPKPNINVNVVQSVKFNIDLDDCCPGNCCPNDITTKTNDLPTTTTNLTQDPDDITTKTNDLPTTTTNLTQDPAGQICNKPCAKGVLVGCQCLHFSEEKLSWKESIDACVREGGRLATLDEPADIYAYIIANYPIGVEFWTGASDTKNEGTFVWLNGDNVQFEVFGQDYWDYVDGNHGSSDINDCVYLQYVDYNDKFWAQECSDTFRYICEFDW